MMMTNKSQTIEIEVTKLYKVISERGLSQKDLYSLIAEANNGKKVPQYILNGIINGNRENYNIKTAQLIANALQVTIDDIVG